MVTIGSSFGAQQLPVGNIVMAGNLWPSGAVDDGAGAILYAEQNPLSQATRFQLLSHLFLSPAHA